jgi:hypothetical protein
MNIIEVTYIAVHVDNYQGGSGEVYTKKISINVEPDCLVKDIFKVAYDKLAHFLGKSHSYFPENVMIINISIIETI